MIDHKKEVIQEEALRAWIQANKRGTVEIITGLGKTFIAFKAIQEMPKHSNVLILAETQLREHTIREDADKFASLYGFHPFDGYNVKFMCYQSAHKYLLSEIFQNKLPTLVECDEIHEMLAPVYYRFAENNLIGNNVPVLGLSATIDKKTKYQSEEGEYKKIELLNTFAPICYIHNVTDGQEQGTARKLRLYIINHKLDQVKRSIKAGNKEVTFMTTEKANYDYLDSQFRRNLFIPMSNPSREFMIRNSAARKLNIVTMDEKITSYIYEHREEIHLENIPKDYVHLNRITLEKWLRYEVFKLMDRYATVNADGTTQCEARKYRSTSDIYWISKYYFPDLTIEEFYIILWGGHMSDITFPHELYLKTHLCGHWCPDVQKYVFCNRPGSDHGIMYTREDEFDYSPKTHILHAKELYQQKQVAHEIIQVSDQ